MSNIPSPVVTVIPLENWTILTEANGPVSEKSIIEITTTGTTVLPTPPLGTTFTSVYVNAPGAVTITMPVGGTLAQGQSWLIKDISGAASTNNITINGNGYELDESASFTLNVNNGDITLEWNGANMSIVT